MTLSMRWRMQLVHWGWTIAHDSFTDNGGEPARVDLATRSERVAKGGRRHE